MNQYMGKSKQAMNNENILSIEISEKDLERFLALCVVSYSNSEEIIASPELIEKISALIPKQKAPNNRIFHKKYSIRDAIKLALEIFDIDDNTINKALTQYLSDYSSFKPIPFNHNTFLYWEKSLNLPEERFSPESDKGDLAV